MGRNFARLTWAYLVEPTWLEVNQVRVPLAGLSTEHPGLKVVHLTDFHLRRHMPLKYVSRSIAVAAAQRADIVVLTGDFVHRGFRNVRLVRELLKGLDAPLGVYAVLGNHDFSVRNPLGIRRHPRLHAAIVRALEDCGVQVLRNRAVHVGGPTMRWAIVGVDDLWSGRCNLERALEGTEAHVPRIILAHNPRTIERLNGHRCDLMLSGHTHGGQIHLPGIGTPTLSPRMRRFAAGLYQVNHSMLYVNKGIGYSLRFRYNRRPEVAVLHLVGAGRNAKANGHLEAARPAGYNALEGAAAPVDGRDAPAARADAASAG
ncbi:MAG: phosphodiesterase YaeI [Planctomycetes bacterium]|nr:phosphodiesterase YaeI [Planctomycetota bacterium]